MNTTPQSQFQQAAQEAAEELFPKPSAPFPAYCDDGWGGCDMNKVKERQLEKAAIINKHFAPLEAQLVDASRRHDEWHATVDRQTITINQLEKERDEARREVETWKRWKQEHWDEKKQQWLNSVTTVCADFSNVAAYISQVENQTDQLATDNQRLREALVKCKEAIIKLNGNCYPLEYCAPEFRYKREAVDAAVDALSTRPPSAVDIELQARKAKAFEFGAIRPRTFSFISENCLGGTEQEEIIQVLEAIESAMQKEK